MEPETSFRPLTAKTVTLTLLACGHADGRPLMAAIEMSERALGCTSKAGTAASTGKDTSKPACVPYQAGLHLPPLNQDESDSLLT